MWRVDHDVIASLKKQFRCANYISAAQLYLRENFLLTEELTKDHIKRRQLGHWGSIPGTSFMYICLNYLITQEQANFLFMLGPGHAAPAVLSQLFLEGTLGDFYPEYQRNGVGLGRLIKNFSWPGGLPSHVNPATPGCILEGGELGYSLATAYGAVFDNPDLIVACVIGDGEAETGPLAAAWHSNKFLNPATSGAVLPMINLNGYKISQPTVYGSMSDDELMHLFTGLGYNPKIVDAIEDQDKGFENMLLALQESYMEIRTIQDLARNKGIVQKPKWPMLIVKTLKGWTGVKEFHGEKIEGNYKAHGVPIIDPQLDDEKFLAVKQWLESYKIDELFDEAGTPHPDILKFIPAGGLRMGMNKYANGVDTFKELKIPDLNQYELAVDKRGAEKGESTFQMGKLLRDIFVSNKQNNNFRFFCPDETTSNKLDPMFEVTNRAFMWPLKPHDDMMATDGRIMEILSEHTLQGWMQGYVLTGRHGMMSSYEAFIQIIASMVDQHAKFIQQAKKVPWRKDIASVNYLLSSLGWRQEHNGFSHQNPGFISNMLDKYGDFISIYFPPDANSNLVITRDCLERKNSINVIVAGKRKLPQWLSLAEAEEQLKTGVLHWEWAGNNPESADVVLAAAGDYMTLEAMAAIQLLKELVPELGTRFVSVSEVTCLGIGDERHPCTIGTTLFDQYFTPDKPIVFNFHGYPAAIQKLFLGHPASQRLCVRGYIDEGSTTTPFDMQLMNRTSRYHLAMDALTLAKKYNPKLAFDLDKVLSHIKARVSLHREYILATGEDPEEVVNWKWQG